MWYYGSRDHTDVVPLRWVARWGEIPSYGVIIPMKRLGITNPRNMNNSHANSAPIERLLSR